MQTRCIHPSDSTYPVDLRSLVGDCAAEPPTIYLRGELPRAPGIAIVGTRDATPEACEFTRALAASLGDRGFSIWSGGAKGIDAAAHQGALDASAPTVVVMGNGFAFPYPKEHVPLFDRVLAAGGALLSRVPEQTPTNRIHLIQRNAVLAALSIATVVIQAGLSSGARSTAAAARRLGRHLCVVPQSPWDPRGQGCAAELASGAHAVTSAADIVAVLGTQAPAPPVRKRKRKASAAVGTLPLLPDERAIAESVARTPMHIDELCEKTGLSPRTVSEVLLTLTLHGVVVQGPAGLYRLAPSPLPP